jgi:nickel-type superoxide dismutase maturation protease
MPKSGRWVVGAAASALVVALAVGRCVHRVVVHGGSMAPALLDGDRLVVIARLWGPPPRRLVGDVVAVPDPRAPDRILVKRVASVDLAAGTVEVLGDAPDASTDSRQFGPVPLSSVVGRVVHRYGPPGRSGPVRRSTEYHRS